VKGNYQINSLSKLPSTTNEKTFPSRQYQEQTSKISKRSHPMQKETKFPPPPPIDSKYKLVEEFPIEDDDEEWEEEVSRETSD
jgi:hypothetical protein